MLQNLEWLVSYQIGYMYLRYLMWNFSGRQNDVPSQGGAHGNFITGFTAVDNLMLGQKMPFPHRPDATIRDATATSCASAAALSARSRMALWPGRRGRQAAGTVAVLFRNDRSGDCGLSQPGSGRGRASATTVSWDLSSLSRYGE